MQLTINIDRFTRLKQTVSGKLAPGELSGLAEFLADEGGEINYSLTGNLFTDLTGSQERRVKCIIYGWFLLSDPVTLAAVRHELSINSSLVLVNRESELPPLEMESEHEDYIVCGTDMNVAERIEEEILLSLPSHAVKHGKMNVSGNHPAGTKVNSKKSATLSVLPVAEGAKISPFAKLAGLKKK